MATPNAARDHDRRHDRTIEDSFPASDPPSHSGMTGPRSEHGDAGRRPPSHERSEHARPKGTPTHDRHAAETAHVWEDEEHPQPRR